MNRFFFASCLLLLITPLCPAQPLKAPARVPFELLPSHHIVVKVRINGKGPYRLIFDTGAPVTLINNKLAKETGVITKDSPRPLFAPFGSMGQFSIKKFQLGDVAAENLPTVVMDHPTVELMSKLMGPVDGIVGMSFFGRYKMTIDYQAKELTFVPGSFQPPDIMKKMMAFLLAPSGEKKKIVVRPAGILGFEVQKGERDEEPGVNVVKVLPGSPAERAGLKEGDRLLELDDRWTDSVLDCYAAARHLQPGASVQAILLRGGQKVALTIEARAGL